MGYLHDMITIELRGRAPRVTYYLVLFSIKMDTAKQLSTYLFINDLVPNIIV
jgi:hypothetical protein